MTDHSQKESIDPAIHKVNELLHHSFTGAALEGATAPVEGHRPQSRKIYLSVPKYALN